MYEMLDIRKKYSRAIVKEEDLEIAAAVREFIDKEVMPRRLDLEGGWHHDENLAKKTIEEIHKGLVDLGVQRAFLPEEIGGLGIKSLITQLIVQEEIARGDAGLATRLGCLWGCLKLAEMAGRMDLLEIFGRKACDDKPHVACWAVTEPQGGANIEDPTQHGRAIRTIAVLDGDEWVINGVKIWPGGAGEADIVYATVCTTDPAKGEEGIAYIYVPPDAPGLSFGKPIKKMGMCYTDVNAEIFYDNVRVPKEYRLGGPGKDAEIFHNNIAAARLPSAATAVGVAEACLETILAWTKERKIMGKPVREHSLFAGIIGEMALKIETARAYYLQVAWMAEHPEIYGPVGSPAMHARCSIAKAYAADAAVWVANKAMELMGSYGYAYEQCLEKYLRDVKVIQLWEGGQQRALLDVALGFYSFEW
ncbi:MAG: acyl-CoA dehydrogenase family protein [Candidatus Bathyarchaeia archaeon]